MEKESDMKRQRMFLIGLSAAGLTLAAGVADAATYTWNNGGGADVNWTTTANWGGAGYPHLTGDIAILSLANDVTLNASVTLGRISLSNSVARTVNVTGTGGAVFTLNMSSGTTYLDAGTASGSRLVIAPDIVTQQRIDKRLDGTLEIQGKILDTIGTGYGFIPYSGLTVFSGSSSLIMSNGIAGIGMSPTLTRMVLTNAATWIVSEIQTGVSGARVGSVVVSQDSADTSVTAGTITLGYAGSLAGSFKDYYYLRDGRLSASSLLVGRIIPGVFDMSGGTFLLRGGNITTNVLKGEFRLGGGTWQVTNLNSYTFSYCRMPVKVSGAAAMELLGTSRLYLSGGISGDADWVKTGAGPLSFDSGTSNALSGRFTISNGLVQVLKNTLIESYDGSTNAWSMKICNGGSFALTHDTALLTQPLDLVVEAGGLVNFAATADGNPNFNIIVARTFVTNGVSLPQGRYLKAQLPGVYTGTGVSGAVVVPATWTGAAGDGKWSTGANWSTGEYPNGINGVADLSLAEGPVTLDTNVRLTCLVYNPQGAVRELTVTGDGTLDIYPPVSSPNLFVGPGRKLTLDVPVTITAGDDNYNAMIFGGGTVELRKGCPNKSHNPVFSVFGTLLFTGTSTPAQMATATRGPAHDGTVVFGPGCAMTCARILNHPQYFYIGAYSVGHPIYPVEIIHDGGDVTSGDVWVMRHQAYTSKPFGYFMRSGSLTTTDSTFGITLGGYYAAAFTNRCSGGSFIMTGGRVETHRFSMGFSDNAISLQKGDVTLGAGGIVFTSDTRGVPPAWLSSVGPGPVSLGGVVLRAKAAWGSVLDMTLTGTNGNTVVSNAAYAVSLAGNLSGPGGLVKMGGGTLTLGGTNTFTGPLAVAEGTLAVNNVLVNATNLSVTAAGAVLTLGSADSLNTNATLTVAAGGMLNLNYSGTATVNALVVAGEEKSPGTYTSGRSYITGTGALVVRSGPPTRGTLLTIQ